VSCFDGRVLTCRPLWAMTCRPRTLSVVAAVLVVLVKPFAVHFYLEHLPSSSTAIWQLEVACELLKPVRPPSLLPRSRMRHEGTDQDVGDPALIGLGCFVAPKAPLVTKQFLAWLAAPVDGDPLMDPNQLQKEAPPCPMMTFSSGSACV
jgi:hypothetical protein